MIGEAEFAVAPLLWNRIGELDRSDPRRPPGALRDFSAAAGLNAETARQWGLAREVENALWYASRRGNDGDLARSLWVASTLAGRTFAGAARPARAAGHPGTQPEGRPRARPGSAGAPRRQGGPDGADGDRDVVGVRGPVADRDPQARPGRASGNRTSRPGRRRSASL